MRCGGDIVTLLWFRVSMRWPCEHNRNYTVVCLFSKLGRHVYYDNMMNFIDFGGQSSKLKVTIDIYGKKLVNTIETKLMCASSLNLADILANGRVDPIEFGGQRSKFKVTIDIYGNMLVNLIETKSFCASPSNLAEILTIVRGWTLLILEVRGQSSGSQQTYMVISLWTG